MSFLSIDKISKSYGSHRAVDTLSFEVSEGECLALLGPSGCGKTTLLNIVAGFVKPDAGEISIAGKRITDVPAHRRDMGMVFQDYALFPHFNVTENVEFGLRMRGVPLEERRRVAAETLKLVGLAEYGERGVSQLSGGQRQRVAVARALATRPKLLLFDEPLSNLDAGLRDAMRVEIRHLITRTGITALFVTHDQSEAFSVADRVAVLNKGHLEQIGTPDHIYNCPANAFCAAFLGGCNLIPGRVVGVDDAMVTIAALATTMRAARVEGIAPPGIEQAVTLAIRPHHMMAAPSLCSSDGNRTEAAVETVENLGWITRIALQHASGQLLTVVAQGHVHASGGDRMELTWTPAHTWLLTEGAMR